MSRIRLIQGLLLNLKQELPPNTRAYLSKEEAYAKLKEITGQDFGYDVQKWKEWFKQNKKTRN